VDSPLPRARRGTLSGSTERGWKRLAAPVGRPARRRAIAWRTQTWPAHSRLFVAGDGRDWAIGDDARQIARLAGDLGARIGPESWISAVRRQSVFHASQFALLGQPFERDGNRLGVAYLHGRPGTPGMPEFDTCYETVRRRHAELDRIQVPSAAMEELVLGAGVSPEKVLRIPIGIDLDRFRLRTPEDRRRSREALGLPGDAFIAGSFQKDGVGWAEGLEPKLIKGPDLLVAAAVRLHERVPELHVLLTGPARGYVRRGLEEQGVPYRHVQLADLDAVADAYRSLDVALVTSRDEGGPKAVLESMATGVPLVTTRVGQAADLVRDGENGYLVEVGDAEAVAEHAARVAEASPTELEALVAAGRETAEACSYRALAPKWRELLTGFVDLGQT
jgi:glycosyltransferase involved in cell wall biosynthesis